MSKLEIVPGKAPLSLWRKIADGAGPVTLADTAWPTIERSRALIENALASGQPIYGVNTGSGKLAQTRIAAGDLKALQRNLVLSHAAGVGAPLPDWSCGSCWRSRCRACRGEIPACGRSWWSAARIVQCRGVLPEIPSQGSVGASGDLARWPILFRSVDR